MTPVEVKWIYVYRGIASAGELRPVLCAKGETEIVGLVLAHPVFMLKRPERLWDALPPVFDYGDRLGEPKKLSVETAVTMAKTYADMGITLSANRLLGWFSARCYTQPGLIDTGQWQSEEPAARGAA